MGKALYELSGGHGGEAFKVFSMYDKQDDLNEKYFPASVFKGFHKNKLRFVFEATRQGIKSEQVIISHCNLLLAGFLIKLLSPKTRVVLLAHGIEVWSPLPSWKKYMLGKCDQVLAVSSFTKDRMLAAFSLEEKRITVLNNCLDPFLPLPGDTIKNQELLNRYGLMPDNIVLLTITRLSSKEQYKGYDNVLYAVKDLKEKYPLIKYLLVGKYDEKERRRVDKIIAALKLEGNMIFAGFIPDEELADHYNIADLYIMPSKKEGFGIVFLEAMYYGKPVIAGNKDGSADALNNGKFGLLINPDDRQEISNAIIKVISNKTAFIPDLQEVMEKFSYPVYKEKLRKIIERSEFLPSAPLHR